MFFKSGFIIALQTDRSLTFDFQNQINVDYDLLSALVTAFTVLDCFSYVLRSVQQDFQ